jgi:ATP/ADP translocase
MLYIPLNVDEKFKAKAIIDVFAYRTAKACASLIILGLSCITLIELNLLLSWGVVVIFLMWAIAVLMLFKHYYEKVENHPKEV